MSSFSREGPPEPAGLRRRALARLIDVVILAASFSAVVLAVSYSDRSEPQQVAITTSLLVLLTMYEVVGIWKFGATLGKRAVGIAAVSYASGEQIRLGRAGLRYGLFLVAAASSCGAGGLLVALSPTFDSSPWRRGWQDKVADSVVIRR